MEIEIIDVKLNSQGYPFIMMDEFKKCLSAFDGVSSLIKVMRAH